mmetsp:Transcript_1915/g.3457  ORF Transcript_1915/g.3457 Transcript_1915/m.3457 type:complete len:90 (+) Transcript_1915:689-958(+)
MREKNYQRRESRPTFLIPPARDGPNYLNLISKYVVEENLRFRPRVRHCPTSGEVPDGATRTARMESSSIRNRVVVGKCSPAQYQRAIVL